MCSSYSKQICAEIIDEIQRQFKISSDELVAVDAEALFPLYDDVFRRALGSNLQRK